VLIRYYKKFLKAYHKIYVLEDEYWNESIAVALYKVIIQTTSIWNDYNNSRTPKRDFAKARDELGNLLISTTTKLTHESSLITFRYLIEKGAPITYKKENVLAEAIKLWGLSAIKLISSKRLTNYMRDRTKRSWQAKLARAHNLIVAIAKYITNNHNAKLLIDYMFENDVRIPIKKSLAYNELRQIYKNNRNMEMYNYMNSKLS